MVSPELNLVWCPRNFEEELPEPEEYETTEAELLPRVEHGPDDAEAA
jgi:hypothetical protein